MEKKVLNRKKINPSIPVFTGVKQVDITALQLFEYNKDNCSEDSKYSEKKFNGFLKKECQYWLNIHGIHDVETIKEICTKLNVHDLVIQDILDVNQRPKFQRFETYCFFTIKSIIPSANSKLEQEQISFILGSNYLVSFQERKADYFSHIRERLRKKIGIIRERSSDYLLFLLLESILDNYFKSVNKIETKLENFEIINIDTELSPGILKSMELFKRQIYQIKKAILPIKESVIKIEHEKLEFIYEKHIKYFYELKDLCLSLIDDCEQIEVKLESYTNLFFSVQGHRLNQVMKTLTVVATIFIPLTFIAGIYGMNFSNMPELNWKYGYLIIWVIMIAILTVMVIYFKKKKWF
jgi:magnesium transporter